MPTSLKDRKQQHPIRTGCYVEFINTFSNGYQTICKGDVTQDTYDADGHHTFTVQSRIGPKSAVVSGAKLYSNLLHHVPRQSLTDRTQARLENVAEKNANSANVDLNGNGENADAPKTQRQKTRPF